jgi:hypothetical protein
MSYHVRNRMPGPYNINSKIYISARPTFLKNTTPPEFPVPSLTIRRNRGNLGATPLGRLVKLLGNEQPDTVLLLRVAERAERVFEVGFEVGFVLFEGGGGVLEGGGDVFEVGEQGEDFFLMWIVGVHSWGLVGWELGGWIYEV